MKKRNIILLIVLVIIIIVTWFFISKRSTGDTIRFETIAVTKGDIFNTVTATGTIQAITTVQVGTQVSGVIKKINVDYNSKVKKGQLLAQLDETPLKAALAQSMAAVQAAQADLVYKKETYDRNKVLFEKQLISKADWDQAVYNYNTSKANLLSAQATNERNKANLEYASIYSPIDGVVLNRAVDEGQTVAASFNTPTLFTIANDLTRMQVQANVDEADIGQVKMNEHVEFTVDAYPDQSFAGTVTQIRLQPVVTNNVVTYTIIIEAPNPDQKLMPGMTATANIYISEVKNVLTLSNKALRFNPDQKAISAMMKGKTPPESNFSQRKIKKDTLSRKGPIHASGEINKPVVVWVKKGPDFFRTRIQTGLSDGTNTEIKSGLNEGDEVVVSAGTAEKGNAPAAQERSPFMPRRPSQRTAPRR
jgi:HlyD family secretion protein